MNLWQSLEGMVSGELTGADPGTSLQRINESGIPLADVEWVDELTVRFRCFRRDRRKTEEICRKRGDELHFREESGLFYLGRNFLKRPVLAAGVLLLFTLTLYLPTRVLFVQVEGNETTPARQILSAAEDCGIRFGASRRAVRSEKMKNALLAALPELKWAGINTTGCTAAISVREREQQQEEAPSTGISSIVAARDGYITSCTVTRGNGLCVPGQVVQEGQVLISGYTDCGICIQVTDAQGEIFAQTSHDFQAVMPAASEVRLEEGETKHRYSLILGKKRINFWKGSGISDTTCGRMYEEYYITLPGGFRLPVCIAAETLTDWDSVTMEIQQQSAQESLKRFARESVLEQTVAGSILREEQTVTREKDRYVLSSRFLCSEMIGRVITEEIGDTNGKTN